MWVWLAFVASLLLVVLAAVDAIPLLAALPGVMVLVAVAAGFLMRKSPPPVQGTD